MTKWLAVGILILCVLGCGGGGSSGPSPVRNATFQIIWPARSRGALNNPLTSALSVAVTLPKVGTNGSDVTMKIDRDATQVAGYTGTYTIDGQIDPNALSTLTATFYAQPAEQGVVVGSATASVTLSGKSILIASVVLSGVIKTVSVVPETPITVGSGSTQLLFSAGDGAGNTVAVTPGSAIWAVASGGSFLTLTKDGIATPTAAGPVNVTATVDGVVSSPAEITVENVGNNGGNGLANSPWPKFRGNALSTGLGVASGIQGNVTWTSPGTFWSSPSIGSDGTVYMIGNNASWNLFAIGAGGALLWTFPLVNGSKLTPVVGADGTIYAASSGLNLCAVNPNGTLKWKFPLGGEVDASPAIGPDGTIYLPCDDGNLYAINPSGTKKWAFLTGAHQITSSPAIGTGGTIYFGAYDHNFYAVNPDGSVKWTFPQGPGVDSSPAIGSDGTIYFGSLDDNLYALNPNGSEKWSLGTKGSISASPSIAADGTVYIGSQDGSFYAVNPNGSLKWSFASGNPITSSAAITVDGTVYLNSGDAMIYALNADGTQKWSMPTNANGTALGCSPAIASDGTLYISFEGELAAIH